MQNPASETLSIFKVTNKGTFAVDDQLAVEEPLEVLLQYYNGHDYLQKIISVTMRTPGNDSELAAGFLFTEGILKNTEQVSEIKQVSSNQVHVILKKDETPSLQNTERNFYTTSSCGVCGKTGIDAIKTVSVYPKIADDILISETVLYSLQQNLLKQQQVFKSTGGLHASALFDLEGNIMTVREDVGRHNALDKLIGSYYLGNNLPLNKYILLLSGRASFELIQKAAMAGVKIVVAVGAPSTLAVQLAKESGMTLVGFLRNESFNIYSGQQRINSKQ